MRKGNPKAVYRKAETENGTRGIVPQNRAARRELAALAKQGKAARIGSVKTSKPVVK